MTTITFADKIVVCCDYPECDERLVITHHELLKEHGPPERITGVMMGKGWAWDASCYPQGYHGNRCPLHVPEGVEATPPRIIFPAEEPDGPTPYVVRITRQDILRILADTGIVIPPGVSVSFHTPGGGDYSNCDCELDDKDQVINVRYKK